MTTLFSRWTDLAATRGLRLVAIVVIAVILNQLLRLLTRRLVAPAKSETRVAKMREQQTKTLAGLLYSGGAALIIVVATLLALPEFGFNITPLAAAAGLASLALGFGGQYLVRDLINGFFIAFEDQYVVGDTVRIGESVGRVEHVTLRRTVLRDAQGSLVSIPNGRIAEVANLSRDWSQAFVDVTIPADESVSRALASLEQVAREFRADPDWSAALVDGPRVLGVESLAIAGITLRMQVRTAPLRKDDVARELRRRITTRFEADKISFSSAQRVELVGSEARSPSAAARQAGN
jgi:moderate conductance mechanosensitive channel